MKRQFVIETLATLGIENAGWRQTKHKNTTQHRKLKRWACTINIHSLKLKLFSPISSDSHDVPENNTESDDNNQLHFNRTCLLYDVRKLQWVKVSTYPVWNHLRINYRLIDNLCSLLFRFTCWIQIKRTMLMTCLTWYSLHGHSNTCLTCVIHFTVAVTF